MRSETRVRRSARPIGGRAQHAESTPRHGRIIVAALLLLLSIACATPPAVNSWYRSLAHADRDFDHGRYDEAAHRYAALFDAAPEARYERYIRWRLAVIEGRRGDLQVAIEDLSELAAEPNPESDEWDSQSRFMMAELLSENGHEDEAFTVRVDLVARHPDSAGALHAFKDILRHFDRVQSATTAIDWLAESYPTLEDTELGDNVLYEMALRFRDDLDDIVTAQELFMQLRIRYRDGPLFDDATWHLAAIAHEDGRPEDALVMYEVIAGDHDSSWRFGNYDSLYRGDAMLKRAEIMVELARLSDAIDEYERFIDAFPTHTKGGKVALTRAELFRSELADELGYREALVDAIERFPDSVFSEHALHHLELLDRGVALDDIPNHPLPRARPWLESKTQ